MSQWQKEQGRGEKDWKSDRYSWLLVRVCVVLATPSRTNMNHVPVMFPSRRKDLDVFLDLISEEGFLKIRKEQECRVVRWNLQLCKSKHLHWRPCSAFGKMMRKVEDSFLLVLSGAHLSKPFWSLTHACTGMLASLGWKLLPLVRFCSVCEVLAPWQHV